MEERDKANLVNTNVESGESIFGCSLHSSFNFLKLFGGKQKPNREHFIYIPWLTPKSVNSVRYS